MLQYKHFYYILLKKYFKSTFFTIKIFYQSNILNLYHFRIYKNGIFENSH